MTNEIEGKDALDEQNQKDDRIEQTIIPQLDYAHGDEALRLISAERTAHFNDEYNLKLRRKLDALIPPICAAVYFTQYLDKTSLNYASIMGFPIVGQHYNLVSLSFYLGFLFWEFPTTYIAQKTRLAKYLGANIIVWGVILMLHAVATPFGAFFALRFLLGMCESCVAPILIMIISMFYKKNEQAQRISWFYVMNGVTQIFGGFVAYGISFYDGHVLASYKMIFVVLGGLAIVVGICVLIWLPDSPVVASSLTTEERIAALERVRDDQGGVENKTLKRYQVVEALTDVRTWLVVLSTLASNIPAGGLNNFSNIIIKSFGYTSKQALILSTPTGVFYSLSVLLCGWFADKKNERMTPIIIAIVPTVVGAAMMIGLNGSRNKGALLLAAYFCGTFGSALSTIYAYNASNTSGHTKKSTVNAITLVSFSIGNVVGAEIFQPKDAPDYIPAKIAIMALLMAQIGLSLLIRWINLRLNVQKQRLIARARALHGWTDEDIRREREKHAFADLTDQENIYFVYTA